MFEDGGGLPAHLSDGVGIAFTARRVKKGPVRFSHRASSGVARPRSNREKIGGPGPATVTTDEKAQMARAQAPTPW